MDIQNLETSFEIYNIVTLLQLQSANLAKVSRLVNYE